jgi:hypothetical protein
MKMKFNSDNHIAFWPFTQDEDGDEEFDGQIDLFHVKFKEDPVAFAAELRHAADLIEKLAHEDVVTVIQVEVD